MGEELKEQKMKEKMLTNRERKNYKEIRPMSMRNRNDGIISNAYVNYLNYVLVKLFFTDSLCTCIYFVFILYLFTIVALLVNKDFQNSPVIR